jgi:uncharacterized protein YbjT (DUF2867 family)/tryptophan-rich sensory protein
MTHDATTTGPQGRTALVTGATGYIGGQLVPALLERGWAVRVLTRGASRLRERPWASRIEVVEGDAGDGDAVAEALAGVDVAYYLLHSMDGRGDFVARDRDLATTFARSAERARLPRLVYLSGLHPDGPLSDHLGSRVEVGRIFLDSSVPSVVVQTGVVIGAGSASFDMLRHLTERLPVMVAPKWLRNRIQPIAVADLMHYLAGVAELPGEPNRAFDLGGPEVFTYADLIERYAREVGLGRRWVVTVPVLTPGLASHWVGLVTPVRAGIARPLVGSLVHDAVAGEDDLLGLVPGPPGGRTGFDEAVRAATATIDPLRWRRTVRVVGAATAACAVAGSVLTSPDSAWYRGLRKPSFQPPASAFPLVWTSLFTAIALAASATIAELEEAGKQEEADRFRTAYLANLAVNTAWSGLFFRAHALRTAAVVAGVLAGSAADLARRSAPLGKGKAGVFGAYAAWCAFATVLSASVARLNRSAGRRSRF